MILNEVLLIKFWLGCMQLVISYLNFINWFVQRFHHLDVYTSGILVCTNLTYEHELLIGCRIYRPNLNGCVSLLYCQVIQ